MKEISQDASVSEIKAYLATNNLNPITDALNKMRREIRVSQPDLKLSQKQHYNILQVRSFLNKNAACATINGEWV